MKIKFNTVEKISDSGLRYVYCMVFFSMLYVSVMLANAVLTKRLITLGDHFVFGGAFVSPFIFILGDMIAELFGYQVARWIVVAGFICQTIFALIIELMIHLNAPQGWDGAGSFIYVFGSILRVDLSGVFAYFLAGIINIKLITQWKFMLCGKYFALRSIGASTIAEACCSGIAILLFGAGTYPFSVMLMIILFSYAIKFIFSLCFAYPASMIVSILQFWMEGANKGVDSKNQFLEQVVSSLASK